jgi:hypothetical protein
MRYAIFFEHGDFVLIFGWLELLPWLLIEKEVERVFWVRLWFER